MTATPAPPPRPPALDAGRAAAARDRLAASLLACLDLLAADMPNDGEPVRAFAGCRLLAWLLIDLPSAHARRDLGRIERIAGEVEGLARRLPKHLADCRTPYAWAKNRGGPIEDPNPAPARRGRRRQ